MKPPKAYTEYVEKIVALLQARMMLMEFEIKLYYKNRIGGRRYIEGYSAEVETDTRYMEVKIWLSNKFYSKWKRKDYKDMVAVLCHELAHIYTDPYYEFFDQALSKSKKKQLEHLNEQQTERLSRVFMLNIKPKEYIP